MIKRSSWIALLLIVSACGKEVDKKRSGVIHADVTELKNITSNDSQLVNAVKDGEALLVKESLKQGADVNHYDDKGFRPLAYAIQNGSIEVIETLLEAGAKETDLDIRGNTALHLALMLKKDKALYYLLRLKPELTEENSEKLTPLEYAISVNYVDGVKILLGYRNIVSHDERSFSENEYTSLVSFASHFSESHKIIKLLKLNRKLDNGHNTQQLFFDCLNESFLEGIELIATQVRRIKKIADGQNVIASIVAKSGTEFDDSKKLFITDLIKLGLNINGEKNDSTNPLVSAVKANNYEALSYILSLGANVNEVNKDGETALLVAVENSKLEEIKLLTSVGAFKEYLYRKENRIYKVDICKYLPSYRRGFFRETDSSLKEQVELIKSYLKCD